MKNENAEARYRSLIDNSGGGLTVTEVADDGETVNLYTSDGMLHLLHTTREQWNKDHSSDIYAKVHPDDTVKARALFSVPIENGETRSASYRLKGADGSYTWVRVTGTCSVENGKKHIITIHTDITQQKISEQNEYKIKEMLESVLENITCGICAYEYSASDQNSRVLFANKSYYSMFGYTKEQFDIEVTNTFSLVYPDDQIGRASCRERV